MRRCERGPGFTIVEMLVGIGVTVVLIALLAPGLSGARAQARGTRSLALQRQLIAGLALYAAENAEALPYMGTPGDPFGPIVVNGHNVAFQGYFVDQATHWLSLLVARHLDAAPEALDHRKRADRRGIVRSGYHLTHTAFADPRLFDDAAPGRPPMSYFRATRHGEIAHPSRKGLTLDIALSGPTSGNVPGPFMNTLLAAFADGSARRFVRVRAEYAAYVSGHAACSGGAPVLCTRGGLAGVDE